MFSPDFAETQATDQGDRGPTFVGPILFHGGVPDSCLPEYFREVAWKWFVSKRLVRSEEIRSAIKRWRDEAKRASTLQRDLEDLDAQIRQYRRFVELCTGYLNLDHRLGVIRKQRDVLVQAVSVATEILDLRCQRENLFSRLQAAERRVVEFSQRHRELLSTKAMAFEYRTNLDDLQAELHELRERLLACDAELNKLSQRRLGQAWQESFSEPILGLPPDVLRETIVRLNELRTLDRGARRRSVGLAAAGTVVGAAGPLLACLGGPWGSAVVLSAGGVALLVTAVFSLARLKRFVQTEEHRIRAPLEQFPGVDEMLRGGDDAVTDLEGLQHVLVERKTIQRKLQELDDRLADIDKRTFGLMPGAGVPCLGEVAAGLCNGPQAGNHPDLFDGLLLRLGVIREMVDSWCKEVEEAERRRWEAETAKPEVNEIHRQLDNLAATIDQEERRLECLVGVMSDLGLNAFQFQPDRVSELRSRILEQDRILQQEEMEVVRRLQSIEAELAGHLGNGVSASYIQERREAAVEKLEAAEKRWRAAVESAGVAPPYREVDRPTQRFLLHGEEWADEFVSRTVSLLALSCHVGCPHVPARLAIDVPIPAYQGSVRIVVGERGAGTLQGADPTSPRAATGVLEGRRGVDGGDSGTGVVGRPA